MYVQVMSSVEALTMMSPRPMDRLYQSVWAGVEAAMVAMFAVVPVLLSSTFIAPVVALFIVIETSLPFPTKTEVVVALVM